MPTLQEIAASMKKPAASPFSLAAPAATAPKTTLTASADLKALAAAQNSTPTSAGIYQVTPSVSNPYGLSLSTVKPAVPTLGITTVAQGTGPASITGSGIGPLAIPKVSTTTLSNTNKIDTVPVLTSALDQYSNKGITTNATGTPVYADGTIARVLQSTVKNPDGSTDKTYSDGSVEHTVAPTATTPNSTNTYDPSFLNQLNRAPDQIASTATNPDGTTTVMYKDGQSQKVSGGTSGPTAQAGADTSYEDTQTNALLDSMKANLDANTKTLIDSIQQKFAARETEQTDINRRQQAGVNSALLMGGLTGQGSSSQYAPLSSGGIVSTQESFGVKELADLDAQENDAIAAAKQAQTDGNYKILDQKLALVDAKRKEKIAAATKLNDAIAEQNKTLRDKNIQSAVDTSIANVYASGTTDVPGILAALKSQGVTATADDVAKTLKNIVPVGLDDLVKTLKANGAPTDVIQKVLASKNISEAYTNAGDYAAGGTGIVAEYNFYKAQAAAAGQVPVDFSTYQNEDANRKQSIARAGVATTPSFTTDENGNVIQTGNYDSLTIGRYNRAVNAATTILQKNPTFKNIVGSSAYLDRIEAAVNNPGSIGDQELLDAFTQLNTGGNRVTDAQVKLITGSQSFADAINKFSNKLKKGGSLSDAQRSEITKLAHEVYQNYQKSYLPLYTDTVAKLQAQGIPKEFWNLPSPDTLSRSVNESSTGTNLVGSEDQAKQSVVDLAKNNPDVQKQVRGLLADPSYTYSDILQILNGQ